MRYILTIVLIVFGALMQHVEGKTHLEVDSVSVCRDKDSVQVSFAIHINNNVKIADTDLIWLTPRLKNQNDSIDLPVICVYGRNPYYSYVRSGPYSNYAEMQIRGKRAPDNLSYVQNVEFQEWMKNASLVIVSSQTNSCGSIIYEACDTAYVPPIWFTAPSKPIIEERQHAAHGTAYVDFVVNKTDIRPDYHDNQAELDKMRMQIDAVLNDTAATAHRMTIHGYASPEGSYKHNTELARDRTANLKAYLDSIYNFPEGFIKTEFTPEDWDGFWLALEESDLPHKREIQEMILLEHDFDDKLRLIRQQYPKEYKFILTEIFPFLRHSDYTIEYSRREVIEHAGKVDTLQEMKFGDFRPATPLEQFRSYRPWFALKTNMLFDLAAAVNVELEVAFGKDKLWSAMVEWWTPWYVWHHNSRAYEFQTLGFELRRWFRNCRKGLPPLTGTFVGLYYNNGKYDLEWNSEGDQGEFNSVGATFGYSWVLNKHLNLELSLSAGVFWGPRRHYLGMFDDTHLIWQYNARTTYVGPTKAKVSLVWLIGKDNKLVSRLKGGAYE